MKPPLPDGVRLGGAICGELTESERREWWLANGLGAFAAGTVAGTLTRRYHGLLVAPVQPPLGRVLVLAKADATLVDGDAATALFANRWGDGSLAPASHVHIESFQLDGRMPVWRWAVGAWVVEQRIWMEPGAHTTCIAWRLVATPPGAAQLPQLRVTLLANARDFHGSGRPGDFNPAIEGDGTAALRVQHGEHFALHLLGCGGTLAPRHEAYENFDLPVERERGLPDRDSHLAVGQATLALAADRWVGVVASMHADADADLAASIARFVEHDRQTLHQAHAARPELSAAPPWIDQMVLAADSFVFARRVGGEGTTDTPGTFAETGVSVIAGYPWFGDWGRDTMIALPGLTLATGRPDTALRILRTFARFVDGGMLPNVFPGAGDRPEYNTADAALWYVEAWRAYVAATDDRDALRQVFAVLCDIIQRHVSGTRYGIQVDSADGLLRAGDAGVQITWMDAKVGDWVVTPRIGKPVEINALWFNAVSAMAEFAALLQLPAAPFEALAQRSRTGFQRFIAADGALLDVLDGPAGDDASCRPNQIFAVSLPHSPLTPQAQAAVVDRVARELLTPVGLRSLAAGHPDYRPHYVGGVWQRDGSYHQGPVWAWLLGHYALAEYRVSGNAQAAQARLAPLGEHLLDAGLGTVSEIFDGAPPHRPRGCPAQAWSVACTLAAWVSLERARRSDGLPRAAVQPTPPMETPDDRE